MAATFKSCAVAGCNGNAAHIAHGALGFCLGHYRRFKRYGDPVAGKPSPRPPGPCDVPGCEAKRSSARYCRNHEHRSKKYGDPLAGRTFNGEPLRWLTEHQGWRGDGCLTWPFARRSGNYGRFRTQDGRQEYAHRRMCELVNGPPPSPRHEAAHSCGRGHEGCVAPEHLRWDTPAGNAADRALHGTENHGERNGQAKLTEADVREIRALAGREAQRETAKRFGIARQTVGDIQTGRRWAFLD
jgi:hypothetical protein